MPRVAPLRSLLLAAAASVAQSSSSSSSSSSSDLSLVPLESLSVSETALLLQSWDVPSVSAACVSPSSSSSSSSSASQSSSASASPSGCDGQTLLDLFFEATAAEDHNGSGKGHSAKEPAKARSSSDESSGDWSQVIADTASWRDVMRTVRKVGEANARGGVEAETVQQQRRRLSSSDGSSGIWIKKDNAELMLGENGDVTLYRSDAAEASLSSNLVVDGGVTAANATIADWAAVSGDLKAGGDLSTEGDLTVAGFATFQDGVTIGKHLEVDETISTGFGRITRDFHQYYTTTSTSAYYQVKTSIKVQGAVMYRLEVLGYAYGAASSIDSVTTGYTYSGWDCVSNEENIDYAYGEIGVYCSSDGYVVLEMYIASTYYLGLTVSGWFLNPTGTAHDIEVLDTAFSSSTGYFSGRRALEETELLPQFEEDPDTVPARPIIPDDKPRRVSVPALQSEVAGLHQEVQELKGAAEDMTLRYESDVTALREEVAALTKLVTDLAGKTAATNADTL